MASCHAHGTARPPARRLRPGAGSQGSGVRYISSSSSETPHAFCQENSTSAAPYFRGGLSNHAFNIAPDLLDQDFSADGPNQKWAGDISYFWTSEGWLYLAVILDLYSRRVIGWAVSNRMKRDLAIRALDMAVALPQPPEGCIHHTDRGSQYCSHDYQKRLKKHASKCL